MGMNRRDFLKGIIATSAAVIAPSFVLAESPKLKEMTNLVGKEYGSSFPFYGVEPKIDLDEVITEVLLPHAKKTIGSGMVEIRMKLPTDWGFSHGIAWYTNEGIATMPQEIVPEPMYVESGGYMYCGRVAV